MPKRMNLQEQLIQSNKALVENLSLQTYSLSQVEEKTGIDRRRWAKAVEEEKIHGIQEGKGKNYRIPHIEVMKVLRGEVQI